MANLMIVGRPAALELPDGDEEFPLQYLEVQGRGRALSVVRHPGPPLLQNGEVLVEMITASFCGSDLRHGRGDKEFGGGGDAWWCPGHEGVGQVVAVGPGVDPNLIGRIVVVMPHVYAADHDAVCPYPVGERGGPRCCALGHTRHLGFRGQDPRGTFSGLLTLPVKNIWTVEDAVVKRVSEAAPDLPLAALLTQVEPLACVLTGFERVRTILDSCGNAQPRTAAIVGCGPVGALWAFVLAIEGWPVRLIDVDPRRAALVKHCVGMEQVDVCKNNADQFGLVVVAASKLAAIEEAECRICEGGIVYLFSGLDADDRDRVARGHYPVNYQIIHQDVREVHASVGPPGKRVWYAGSSGYFAFKFGVASALLAEYPQLASRMVTGVIRGLDSRQVESRLPGGMNLDPGDDPAVIEILNGRVDLGTHLKVAITLQEV